MHFMQLATCLETNSNVNPPFFLIEHTGFVQNGSFQCSFYVRVGLLRKVESPIRHVEESKDGREDHSSQHVDLLGPRRELVQPGL